METYEEAINKILTQISIKNVGIDMVTFELIKKYILFMPKTREEVEIMSNIYIRDEVVYNKYHFGRMCSWVIPENIDITEICRNIRRKISKEASNYNLDEDIIIIDRSLIDRGLDIADIYNTYYRPFTNSEYSNCNPNEITVTNLQLEMYY